MLETLDRLEAQRKEQAKVIAQQLDPQILAFARSIREKFGESTKLYRWDGQWPGGSNVK